MAAIDLQEAQQRLKLFEERHSRDGLFRRYAARRPAKFLFRQIFTFSSVVLLLIAAQPWLALLAFVLACLGEGLDCLLMLTVERRLKRGVPLQTLRWQTTVSAAAQSGTAAVVVALPAIYGPSPFAMSFCLACLTGTGINSSFAAPFHFAAAYMRFAVIALTALSLTLMFARTGTLGLVEMWLLVFAVAMSFFTINAFYNHTRSTYEYATRRSREILEKAVALAQATVQMQQNEREIRKLALVAQNANDSVFISDANGVIAWVNKTFTRLTGFSAAEAAGHRPAELLNGPNTSAETSAKIQKAIQTATPMRTEILNYTKDHREIWVETNQVPVLGESGEVETVIAIERNITVAKQQAAELAAAKRAAEEGERAKAQFLATMSHEIRTPMHGIIGMAELLSETTLPKEQARYVQTIRTSAEALLRIINDILDYSRLDEGEAPETIADFDLLACVEAVLALLGPKAHAQGIFLDLECLTPVPDQMRGDDGHIRQILLNVIGNAIKFTKEGGVSVALSVGNREREGERVVTIEVKDTGIGIDAAHCEQIFDRFSQADSNITREFGGTGLGLTISRMMARKMGGDITVVSELGRGACFTIRLLLKSSPEAAQTDRPAQAAPAKNIRLPGLKALVAEDNATNRLLMKTYFKDTGIDVLYARNGHEAVKLTKRHGPKVVFMDMSMPEMDGLEATRAIRRSEMPQPTIIALTANAHASDKAACLSAGMDGFLSKPLKRAELLSCLSEL